MALAQTLNPEEEGCLVRNFTEQAYTPFRIIMNHDPAIDQIIRDQHSDPLSSLIFDQVEQDPEEPTSLSFYTNSTDNWRIFVDMTYKVEAKDPRPITITYEADNRRFLTETIYREGFEFCIVYFINAHPPPPEFSEDQVLELAQTILKEEFAIVASSNERQTQEIIASKEQNNAISILNFGIFVLLILGGWANRSKSKKIVAAMKSETKKLLKSRAQMELFLKHERLESQDHRKKQKLSFENLMDILKIELKSMNILKPSKINKEAKEIVKEIAKETLVPDPKQQRENEESYEELLLNTEHKENFDPLHLEEARRNPKRFALNLVKSAKQKIPGLKEKEQEEVSEWDYWENKYAQELENYNELVDEYRKIYEQWELTKDDSLQIQLRVLNEISTTYEHLNPNYEEDKK